MCTHNCHDCKGCIPAMPVKLDFSKLISPTYTLYHANDIKEDITTSNTERGQQDIASHNAKVDIIEKAIAEKDYATLVKLITVTNHNMTSKMSNKISISTSVEINPLCKARQALDGKQFVCPHCFAQAISNARPNARRSCKRNSYILTSIIIPVEYWKVLKLTKEQKRKALNGIRIESLGDTANYIQAVNYINMVKSFREYNFTVWSKNWQIWQVAYNQQGKPDNMVYIHSSMRLNKIDNPSSSFSANYMDYDFTVYEKDYAIEHDEISYNCCTPYESRQCVRDCNDCYIKARAQGDNKHRREILR